MTRKVFMLLPSLIPTGPVKGAIALCNSFVDRCEVTLVALKPAAVEAGGIDRRVRIVRLGNIGGWGARLHRYREMLQAEGKAPMVVSVSMGLSADAVNLFARRYAMTFASIRGHLLHTYRIDYGWVGVPIAVLHFLIMARHHHVIGMTHRMAKQFARITLKRAHIVGNFVDEAQLEPFRATDRGEEGEQLRFVFIGRLTPLKCPLLAIDAVCRMAEQGIDCSLDVFGEGPLAEELETEVAARKAEPVVRFHGNVDHPWSHAARADCLVLPSLSEGISRAALEALYLGVPCVLRDVDSNAEIIRPGFNGMLFNSNEELEAAMLAAARLGTGLPFPRPVLLGNAFRQETCAERFFRLLQES